MKFWVLALSSYEKESFSSNLKANVSHLWHGAPLEHSPGLQWLMAKFVWCVCGSRLTQGLQACKDQGQYPTKLNDKVWTIKDLLANVKNTVFLWETMRKPSRQPILAA